MFVASESSVATVSTRRGIQVDRNINLLVEELCQFEISITGIREMKWFGQDVYENGFLLVHPFWQVNLADSEPVQNNEGVSILLDPTMAAA